MPKTFGIFQHVNLSVDDAATLILFTLHYFLHHHVVHIQLEQTMIVGYALS